MTPAMTDLTAFCKATADRVRLQILHILSRESFGVLELCHIVASTQPALSHHLKVLSSAGLVETRRQGTSIYYRRAVVSTDDKLKTMKQSLYASVDELPLDELLQARKAEVYGERNQQAKSFFEKNAHRLKENQDLIADYHHYASCIDDLLDNEPLTRAASVIEIGPGESDLLLHLAERFGQIIALDNTTEMLDQARLKLGSQMQKHVQFFKGELNQLEESCTANLIVLNMVLHHLASPAQLFTEAFNYLKADGRLLIAELCPHDQAWTREICGDLWMGFDSGELDAWATAAGFVCGQSAYIGLKNGFQVQVRMFEKHQIINS